jgi:hypothetical protein
MATINAPSMKDVQPSGDRGAVHAHGSITLAAAAIADKVRLVKLFAGTKVFTTTMINAALGASSTLAIGFEYVDGQAGGTVNAFIPATSTTAIAKTESIVKPIVLEYDAFVIATVAGAAVTGALDVTVLFEHRGTL